MTAKTERTTPDKNQDIERDEQIAAIKINNTRYADDFLRALDSHEIQKLYDRWVLDR